MKYGFGWEEDGRAEEDSSLTWALRHCVGRCTVQSSDAPRSRPPMPLPESASCLVHTCASNTRCVFALAAREPVLSAKTSPRVFQEYSLI